jgi:hypothetical protein
VLFEGCLRLRVHQMNAKVSHLYHDRRLRSSIAEEGTAFRRLAVAYCELALEQLCLQKRFRLMLVSHVKHATCPFLPLRATLPYLTSCFVSFRSLYDSRTSRDATTRNARCWQEARKSHERRPPHLPRARSPSRGRHDRQSHICLIVQS